jgi:hypothetical protein
MGGHGAFTHCTCVVLHALPDGQPPHASVEAPASTAAVTGAAASVGAGPTFFSVAQAASSNSAAKRSVFMAAEGTRFRRADRAAQRSSNSASATLSVVAKPASKLVTMPS